MQQMLTNLVPYPRIAHMTHSFAPFSDKPLSLGVEDLIHNAQLPENCLRTILDPKAKKISCNLIFRGDVEPSQVSEAQISSCITASHNQFVDYSPTMFKSCFSKRP